MKRIKILYVVALILIGGFNLPAQTESTTLDSLVQHAISVSPKIKMLKAKMKVSEDKIPQVSNLPDPMLTLGLANLPVNSFSFTQEPMTGKIVGLSQAIPFPGKLSSMGKVSGKQAEIVKQEIDDAVNEVTKNVTENYEDLRFHRKAISIMKESKNLLQEIAKVVRTKYSVSTASQQNLIKIELEITNVSDKIEELKGKESSKLAMLNAILLQDSETPIETGSFPKLTYQNLTVAKLDSIAEANRPYLMGVKLAKQKAMLMEQTAKYDYYPNFNLMLQYSQRDEIAKTHTPLTDFFTVMVGISLPLNYGGKVTSKVEESVAMQEMYNQQYNAAMQMLNSNFGSSISTLKTLKERIKLIEQGLLPQANQTLNSSLANYQVGKIDFLNVIDAQNKLYQIETNLYKLKTNYLKEITKLEFLIGSKLQK